MEIEWSVVSSVIGVLTFALSLGSFIFLVRDRFTICRVKVRFGKVTKHRQDTSGFQIPYKANGLIVDVINLGKDAFFMQKLELHSNYLRDKPLELALYDFFGGMEPRSELLSRRRFNRSVQFETLAEVVELPHPKPRSFKVWVEMETETGREFHSNRLSVASSLIELPETGQSNLQK